MRLCYGDQAFVGCLRDLFLLDTVCCRCSLFFATILSTEQMGRGMGRHIKSWGELSISGCFFLEVCLALRWKGLGFLKVFRGGLVG